MQKLLCILLFLSFPFENKMIETKEPYSYELLKKDLSQIQMKYKNEVEIRTIGTSHFGKNIWAVKLGKGKKNIVLIGAHHGREWLTSMLLMKMLETYADAFHKEKDVGSYSTDILNEISIWFIPMLNPDGVSIQQNSIERFSPKRQEHLIKMNEGSKNFEGWKANGVGVDLNRQYPAGWDALNEDPSDPSAKFYKGKSPLEAKEVISITQFIKEKNPVAAVAYHTAGREIFWKYKNGRYLKRDHALAKKIAKLTRYKLGKPTKDATGGGFTDWFITTYHRPAMTIEISYLVGETSPPLSVFNTEWKRNKLVGLMLAYEAKKIIN